MTQNLPQSCETWLDTQQASFPCAILLKFLLHDRPWPDQTHLPSQDVKQLGKFVQTRPAQPTTDTGHPRIIRQLESGRKTFAQPGVVLEMVIRVGHHGPELPCVKGYAGFADTLLAIEHRPGGIRRNQNRNHRPQRKGEDEAHYRPDYIECILQPAAPPG